MGERGACRGWGRGPRAWGRGPPGADLPSGRGREVGGRAWEEPPRPSALSTCSGPSVVRSLFFAAPSEPLAFHLFFFSARAAHSAPSACASSARGLVRGRRGPRARAGAGEPPPPARSDGAVAGAREGHVHRQGRDGRSAAAGGGCGGGGWGRGGRCGGGRRWWTWPIPSARPLPPSSSPPAPSTRPRPWPSPPRPWLSRPRPWPSRRRRPPWPPWRGPSCPSPSRSSRGWCARPAPDPPRPSREQPPRRPTSPAGPPPRSCPCP
jgi:hypothetical protein